MSRDSRAEQVKPPALPVPPEGAMERHLSALNNVLRIFFNRITAGYNAVTGRAGARHIEAPHAVFYSTADQTLGAANTGKAVEFDTTRSSTAMTLAGSPSTQITVEFSGVYTIAFMAQVRSDTAAAKLAYVWTAVNGSDVAFSCKDYNVEGSNFVIEITWAQQLRLDAGDYLEIFWASDDTDVHLDTVASDTFRPAIPSAIVSVFLTSADTGA